LGKRYYYQGYGYSYGYGYGYGKKSQAWFTYLNPSRNISTGVFRAKNVNFSYIPSTFDKLKGSK
jgi:hypothetical protein